MKDSVHIIELEFRNLCDLYMASNDWLKQSHFANCY